MEDELATMRMVLEMLKELHEEVRAMRAEFTAMIAMLREIETLRADEPRRLH